MYSRDIGSALPLVRHLQRMSALSKAETAALADVVNRSPVRTLKARYDLIREGDRPRALFTVVSGWACRHKTLADGRRQILSLLLPGDFYDVHSDLLERMDHSIGALTALRVAEVSHDAMSDLFTRCPGLADGLRRQMLVSAAIQREWTVNVGQRSAIERLAHLFCELLVRLKTVDLVHNDSFDFPLTQSDLADALGLTAVHVNRTLQQLRSATLVQLRGRVMTIPDARALANAAQFIPDYLHLPQDRDDTSAHCGGSRLFALREDRP